MDVKLLKEIDYLTRLIKKHESGSSGNLPNANSDAANKESINMNIMERKTTINSFSKFQSINEPSFEGPNNRIYVKPFTVSSNVYVNPNFRPQNPVIHINPKMHMKPLIHVNPRIVKNVGSTNEITINNTSITTNSQHNLTQMDIKRSKFHAKPLIHVNPKMMSNVVDSTVKTESNSTYVSSDIKKNTMSIDIKKSVYVNPKLMSKLSSPKESKVIKKKEIIPDLNPPICSRLKFIRKLDNTKTPIKKVNMSNILLLSKRKLVRVKLASKENIGTSQLGSHKVKKQSISPSKKIKATLLQSTKKIGNNSMTQLTSNSINSPKVHNAKTKINKYKIDRTVQSLTQHKKTETSQPKKAKYNSMELITIGGIVYKSSRNQLVRRSYSAKRKSASNTKDDKFIIATNGKKLCRLKTVKTILNQKNAAQTTELKVSNLVTSKVSYKNNISNKVKQRSIQILRNKMRKNNQPCLFFQRFGYCANQKKGTCTKLHDKKQISVCKKFLQGKCLLDKCLLSHNVGPEKMPTCKYFLEACCTRDRCPYRHVKVSSNTPICIEFLKGYCPKGNECKLRHEYLCPEYSKSGSCTKGKYCPYPHKPTTSTARQNNKYLPKEPVVTKSEDAYVMENDTELTNHESRLRYYESTDTTDIDLTAAKRNIMKQIQIMKNVETAIQSGGVVMNNESCNNSVTEQIASDEEQAICSENKLPKRPPIGVLPAFIPIN